MNGGGTIRVVVLRERQNSYPQIDTGGGRGQAHVRGGPIRGQGGSKEEELRGLSVGYRHQGIPVNLGYLTPVILQQVYIVLTYRTSQGFYFRREVFVKCLH